MIYWKRGIYFGKTNEKGLKRLREVDPKVKIISNFYFQLLSFIKYVFMIVLLCPILILLLINLFCKYLSIILSIPINKYNDYF